MSIQERKSVVEMLSSVTITGIYSLVVYQRVANGVADASDVFVFWSKFFLILIPISIAARIIITIIFSIVNSVVSEIKGEEEEDIDFVDERDKLISLLSTRNSLIALSIGLLFSFASQLIGFSNHAFFIILISFGLLSDIIENSSKIFYYRRGV